METVHLMVPLGNPQPVPQHLHERPVQELATIGETAALEPRDPVAGDVSQLGQQPRLAHADLADQGGNLPPPGHQVVHQ
jgi:hypothetical protein